MSILSVLRKPFVILAGIALTTILTPKVAQSAVMTQLYLNTQSSDPNIRVADLCPEFTCDINTPFFANNVNTSIITLRNNTTSTITGFSIQLLDLSNQQPFFDTVSSEIFSNVTLANNNTAAIFTGGFFRVGEAVTFIIDSSPETVTFAVQLSSVPEPNLLIGILTFAAFSSLTIRKNKIGL